MDEKTARKYRDAEGLPSASRSRRIWRTRVDPFADVWPEVQAQLEAEPRLRAFTLFDWLQDRHPGRFPDSQRRTFERRVRHWRAKHGPGREVMFPQIHDPGGLAASDFTNMNSLSITIAGQPLDHMVYHFTLTYSNWESATVCFSESFEALSRGLAGSGKHAINYRHVIDSLVRKPGAFENYQYHQDMFPTSHFRIAYDGLCRDHSPRVAVREYLKILQLAARDSQDAVQAAPGPDGRKPARGSRTLN